LSKTSISYYKAFVIVTFNTTYFYFVFFHLIVLTEDYLVKTSKQGVETKTN